MARQRSVLLPSAVALWLLAWSPAWLCSPGSRASGPTVLRAKRDSGEFDFGEFDVPTMSDPNADGGGYRSVMELEEEDVNVLELAPPEAEVFLQRATGEHTCLNCGFVYNEMWGYGDFGPGTKFDQLPDNWRCPECKVSKDKFEAKMEEVAGFAENQNYGLGFNTWTAGQKGILIWSGLFAGFMFFMYGYTLD